MIDKSLRQIQEDQEKKGRAAPVFQFPDNERHPVSAEAADYYYGTDRYLVDRPGARFNFGKRDRPIDRSAAARSFTSRQLGQSGRDLSGTAYDLAVRRINDYLNEHVEDGAINGVTSFLNFWLNPHRNYKRDGLQLHAKASYVDENGETLRGVDYDDMPESMKKIVRDATLIADRTFNEVDANNRERHPVFETGARILLGDDRMDRIIAAEEEGARSGTHPLGKYIRETAGAVAGEDIARMIGEGIGVGAGKASLVAEESARRTKDQLRRGLGAVGRAGRDAYWMGREFMERPYEGSKNTRRAQAAERRAGR